MGICCTVATAFLMLTKVNVFNFILTLHFTWRLIQMETDKSCSGRADFPLRQMQKPFTHERALVKGNCRTPQQDFQFVAWKNWVFAFPGNYLYDLKTEDNTLSCFLVDREGCLLILIAVWLRSLDCRHSGA